MLLYDIGSTNPLIISAKVSADTLALRNALVSEDSWPILI
jgi:hypothetical protein